jgi:hypothetical protein
MSGSSWDPRRAIICGMAGLIDSRNSATSTSMNGQIRKPDILPCSERFDNASALALRTFNSLWLMRAMIWGIACLTNSRNSASSRIVISGVQGRQLYILPSSESLFNATAPSVIMFLRRFSICAMHVRNDAEIIRLGLVCDTYFKFVVHTIRKIQKQAITVVT